MYLSTAPRTHLSSQDMGRRSTREGSTKVWGSGSDASAACAGAAGCEGAHDGEVGRAGGRPSPFGEHWALFGAPTTYHHMQHLQQLGAAYTLLRSFPAQTLGPKPWSCRVSSPAAPPAAWRG